MSQQTQPMKRYVKKKWILHNAVFVALRHGVLVSIPASTHQASPHPLAASHHTAVAVHCCSVTYTRPTSGP